MTSYRQCLRLAKKEGLQHVLNPLIVDVGCNINKIIDEIGFLEDFTKIALEEFSVVTIVAFEPIHFERYEQVYKGHSRVTLVKKALSDRVGEIEIFTPGMAHGLSSAVYRPVFSVIEKKGFSTMSSMVPSTTVDEYFASRHIHYLKVDTEGSEKNVLLGSQQTLSEGRINFIQLEHGGTYQDAGYTIEEIDDFLNDFGYQKILMNATEMLYKKK